MFSIIHISNYNVDDNGGLCLVGGDNDGPWFLPDILVNVRRSGDDAALGVIREVLLVFTFFFYTLICYCRKVECKIQIIVFIYLLWRLKLSIPRLPEIMKVFCYTWG